MSLLPQAQTVRWFSYHILGLSQRMSPSDPPKAFHARGISKQ